MLNNEYKKVMEKFDATMTELVNVATKKHEMLWNKIYSNLSEEERKKADSYMEKRSC